MGKILKNVKGFAMSELLVVSVAILFIFSILFSNYLPLVAEYENRISYNDVTSQYAAHYIRKTYLDKFPNNNNLKEFLKEPISQNGYYTIYKKENGSVTKNDICDTNVNCNKLLDEYTVEEVIISNYKTSTLKEEYTRGKLADYIKYLPTYKNSKQEDTEEVQQEIYRIVLKTEKYGYATTSVLVDRELISEVNEPVLSTNMIPVYYDEEKDVWRKADEENLDEEHQWYDYEKKKWANVVTVYEESQKSEYAEKKINNINPNAGEVNGICNIKRNQISATFDYENNKITINDKNYTLSTVKLVSYTEFPKDAIDNCNEIQSKRFMINATTMQSEYTNGKTIYDLVTQNGYAMFYDMNKNDVLYYVENIDSSSNSIYTFDVYEITTTTTYTTENSYNVGKGYKIENNKFYLTDTKEQKFENDIITNGYKYICTDLKSNSCEEIYEIRKIENYKITEAIKITYEKQQITKLTLADNTTKNCTGENNACTREDYLNSDVGTVIPMGDINSMYVWIPRFKYKIWNYNSTGTKYTRKQQIQIIFETSDFSTGQVTCNDNIQGQNGDGTSEVCKYENEVCTDQSCLGKTYTHPAFTFGDTEYTGIWVGKFENSGESDAITIKPNKNGLQKRIKEYSDAILNMNNENNIYGLEQSDETHMIKNMEWGAIAYFTNSKYGRCENNLCDEVVINNCSKFITGIGADRPDASYSNTTCTNSKNMYNGEAGVNASTTGNVYGIYDLSGGLEEYTMGNMMSKNGTSMQYVSDEVGFDSSNYPENKYIDKYSYNNISTNIKISKLGDGIKEVKTDNNGYNFDTNLIVIEESPWFRRGGTCYDGKSAGIFHSNYAKGGPNPSSQTTRTIIAIKDTNN